MSINKVPDLLFLPLVIYLKLVKEFSEWVGGNQPKSYTLPRLNYAHHINLIYHASCE